MLYYRRSSYNVYLFVEKQDEDKNDKQIKANLSLMLLRRPLYSNV
jgi:hypothetical protein